MLQLSSNWMMPIVMIRHRNQLYLLPNFEVESTSSLFLPAKQWYNFFGPYWDRFKQYIILRIHVLMLIQLGFQKACWNQPVENTKQGVIDLFYNAKFDFKSTSTHDSTACHHKHPTCQYPGEDTMELTSVCTDCHFLSNNPHRSFRYYNELHHLSKQMKLWLKSKHH